MTSTSSVKLDKKIWVVNVNDSTDSFCVCFILWTKHLIHHRAFVCSDSHVLWLGGMIHTWMYHLIINRMQWYVPLFRDRFPGSADWKSLMHTYSLSPGLVLGMVTSSTKELGNWPEDRKYTDDSSAESSQNNCCTSIYCISSFYNLQIISVIRRKLWTFKT